MKRLPLHPGELVWYGGPAFAWLGRVAATSSAHVILLDMQGRLCRMEPLVEDVSVLNGSIPRYVNHALLAATDEATIELLQREGVQEAINQASQADFDPANYDLWTIPLQRVAGYQSLTSIMHRYCAWGAHRRRTFERAVNLLQGRQRDVFLDSVLGGRSAADIAEIIDTTPDNVRMARMRSLRRMRQLIGCDLDL